MNFLEKNVRKHWLIYAISRYLYQKFFSNFFFEPDVNVFKYLKKNKNLNIIDVGSSDGSFSKYLSKFIHNSNFYCFEPLNHLHKNYSLKNNNNLNLIKKGCGKKNQSLKIYTPYVKKFLSIKIYLKFYSSIDLNFLKKNLFKSFKKKNFFSFLVNMIKIKRIDDFKIKADIIKIDTENSENEVVQGCIKTIKKSYPILYIENPSMKLDKILFNLKYKKYQFLKKRKKLKQVKFNNSYSYNYIFVRDVKIFKKFTVII